MTHFLGIRLVKKRLWFKRSLLVLGILLVSWWLMTAISLYRASRSPVDAFFVLGGSIRREIHVARLLKRHPEVPVLISQGSPAPCVSLIFQRSQVPIQRVWLEQCAKSTFDNFYYGLPILQQWRVHRVKLITSQSHLPRATWLAQILLGAHGIWVETEIAPEQGVPGNRESALKTGLDVVRSLIWAGVSQFYSPSCTKMLSLIQVDLNEWRDRGFHCEHQGEIE
ncbi:MAG: YdcF family protein [Scytolyngbya sp. HA4215-MV1]|jgi:uncharacterized SAM-binding protein YcdF (DUF218 family)|nr:YdcF family protein [Scytolyngbya sp. HA4215-MV1]